LGLWIDAPVAAVRIGRAWPRPVECRPRPREQHQYFQGSGANRL